MRRHTLMIDADDTLWENNVFFEKLIEDFITLVEPCGYARAYIRHILNETERKNIRQYGYGVRSLLDVTAAQRTLAQARSADVAARTQVLDTLAEEAFRTGDLMRISGPRRRP